MMAPANKLLTTAGVLGTGAAGAFALHPGLLPLLLVGMVFLVLVVAWDALRGARLVRRVSASLPESARMTKDRESTLEIGVRHASANDTTLRVGLALPVPLQGEEETMTVLIPGHAEAGTVSWPCTPRERGRFLLDAIYVERPSPLGLWRHRRALAAACEVRVYPNLMQERGNLASIFLRRGGLGAHAQRQIGKGRDFEQLRDYIPGDGYEDIHWKATARRGHPITKMYQVERTQEIYVIVDTSRLSARQAAGPDNQREHTTQLEHFVTAALVLGLVAERQGDLFGLATFSDQVHGFIRAKTGREHFNACRDTIYRVQPRIVNPDYDELCAFLRTRLRRRALLFFLTNLDDPVLAESFAKNMELLGRHHLILVNMLAPSSVRPLFSGDGVNSVEDVYARLAGHLQWHELREVQQSLQRRGTTMTLLEHAGLCPAMVRQYMDVKRRQAL